MLNASFSAEGFAGFGDDDMDGFNPCNGVALAEALRRAQNVELTDAVYDFIDQWPSALQKAVQAVIWENFSREETVPITFAWTPAYDYSVTIYDVHDTATTRGGITVLLTSRYPDDVHPLRSRSM